MARHDTIGGSVLRNPRAQAHAELLDFAGLEREAAHVLKSSYVIGVNPAQEAGG